jgi:purine-binding chemotaxis protein CheW
VALPLETVIETMRPLPIEPVPGMPPFLQGVALVRGEPVPVVDLHTLFDGRKPGSPGRFLLLRTGQRRVALAVEAVLGVFRIARTVQQGLPPLLQQMNADLVSGVAVRDGQMLLVLQAARLVPDAVWRELDGRENAP